MSTGPTERDALTGRPALRSVRSMEAQPLTSVGEILALLGRGTAYEGKLCFEGPVRIDGKFEGEAIGDDILVVGPGAEVRGTLSVGTLIVRGGEVWANVTANTLIEIHAGARVHGELSTPKLFIDRGAFFDGVSRMPEAEILPIDEGSQDNVDALFTDETEAEEPSAAESRLDA